MHNYRLIACSIAMALAMCSATMGLGGTNLPQHTASLSAPRSFEACIPKTKGAAMRLAASTEAESLRLQRCAVKQGFASLAKGIAISTAFFSLPLVLLHGASLGCVAVDSQRTAILDFLIGPSNDFWVEQGALATYEMTMIGGALAGSIVAVSLAAVMYSKLYGYLFATSSERT